ncbi:MAG TPA: ATP-binding protein [Thermoanaerobaculia bacterium]|nr:ATP-binding protein [Thermoanaerobaculia bacterium]
MRSHGGSGLGLSISKGIVEGLGGTISVDSAPETGTAVSIRLPCRTI